MAKRKYRVMTFAPRSAKRSRTYSARKIQRAFRRRRPRRRTTLRRPSVKKNARAIRQLYKMSDPKYNYFQLANVNVNSSTSWTELPLSGIRSNLPPFDPAAPPGTTSPQYLVRELDSVQVRLKNIRIHFTLHANAGREGQKMQKYWVALMKTTNGIGSALGISQPLPGEVFDSSSITPPSLLAPWEGFRVTQGPNGEVLKSTTIS